MIFDFEMDGYRKTRDATRHAETAERELAEVRSDRDRWARKCEDAGKNALRYVRERDQARAQLAALVANTSHFFYATDLVTAAAEHDAAVRADERAKVLREDPIALAYGIADHEASGPRVGEVYRRPDGGTMQVVEIKRGSWRSCVYRSETGETHERAHHPSWTLADGTEGRTR